MSRLLIAIDGPAASGKGTLARRIAHHLGLPHLDTGLLYRAVGWLAGSRGLDPAAAAAGLAMADLAEPRLRGDEAGQAASRVAAIPEVRANLLKFQKDFAAQASGAVLDGRDIGTVIAPHADAKLFVTASPEERARRRHAEMLGRGVEISYDAVLADVHARDARDTGRADAPLLRAPDAMLLDNTDMDKAAALAAAIAFVEERRKAAR